MLRFGAAVAGLVFCWKEDTGAEGRGGEVEEGAEGAKEPAKEPGGAGTRGDRAFRSRGEVAFLSNSVNMVTSFELNEDSQRRETSVATESALS